MSTYGTSFDNGQFWVNQNDFDGPGDAVDWHPHKIPHTTIVRYGEVRILLRHPDKRIELYDCGPADRAIHVPAGLEHRIECLKGPARTECLFLHRQPAFGDDVDHNDPTTWKIRETYCGFLAAYG